MKLMRRLLTVCLALLMVPLTGCWDYKEAENRSVVGGMAIDCGTGPFRYHLTFEVADLSDGGGQQTKLKGKIIEADGNTIFDAVKNASRVSGHALYFSDCKIVIFSSGIARKGLTPVFDWLNRDMQPRFVIRMMVSLEDTAGELLQGQPGGNLASYQIFNSLKNLSESGKTPEVSLYQADNILLGQGKDLVLPCLRLKEIGGKEQAEISGTAVFNGDKYAGVRNEEQTADDMLVAGQLHQGVLLVGEKPDKKDITLKIQAVSANTSPQLDGKTPAMKIGIKTKCIFDEENSHNNYFAQLGIKRIEQFASASLEERAERAVHEVQNSFGCDIFGFGRKIYEKDPKLWAELKPDWHQKFRTLKVSINAEVQISNTGLAYPKGYE